MKSTFRESLVNKYKIVPDGYNKFYPPFDDAPPPIGDDEFPPLSDLSLRDKEAGKKENGRLSEEDSDS